MFESVCASEFALGPLGPFSNQSQTEPSLFELSPQLPSASSQTMKLFFPSSNYKSIVICLLSM